MTLQLLLARGHKTSPKPLIGPQSVQEWIDECVELGEPDSLHICSESPAEKRKMH
jgi:GTP-dependent phosphoenolpyruvate carboxykinase